MENFINNWRRPLILGPGDTLLSLALPDGTYRLTARDESATRWEVIRATVAGGTATLERGLEGTEAQEWFEGSVLYQAVTAGVLQGLFAQIADLQSRVTALEADNLPAGALTGSGGQVLVDSAAEILTTGAIA